jgi:hypothetical protein
MKIIDQFKSLNQTEWDHLTALPVYITALIAAADGKIDHAELKKAIAFSEVVRRSRNEGLTQFYGDVSQDFEDKLKVVIHGMPRDKEAGKRFLSSQIAKANAILQKIDRSYAHDLCESFKALARNIAAASGGILGYGSIGHEESGLIDLQMIDYTSL